MEKSLALRTKEFWSWFVENEGELSDIVGKKSQRDTESVIAFISQGVGIIWEDLHFNIGGDYEFTFAVSGMAHLFYLLPYVVACMPEQLKEKWHFFPWMQGAEGNSFGLQMHGVKVDTDEVMVSMELDEEQKNASLRFYSQKWSELPEDQCYSAFFVIMENCIGEGLAHACIRQVDMAEAAEEGMFPLTQLKDKLMALVADEEGNPPDPAQQYFTYRMELEDNGQPRYDVFIGTGCCAFAINAYYNGSGECYDQFAQCGAQLVHLFYPYGEEERKTVLDERYEIMDRLEAEAMGERGSGSETGIMLGGAMGERCAYIDMLLYDQEGFLKKAQGILRDYSRQFQLMAFRPEGAAISIGQ